MTYGICPLNNNPCCGPENCAPAKFSCFTDGEGKVHYNCPISALTDSMQAMAFSMEPFVRGLIGSPPASKPSIEDIGRDKFIADIVRPEGRE